VADVAVMAGTDVTMLYAVPGFSLYQELVLLDANTLEDISKTQKIDVVFNSRYFDRKALDRLLSEAEQSANP
jgi:hypothetical protein